MNMTINESRVKRLNLVFVTVISNSYSWVWPCMLSRNISGFAQRHTHLLQDNIWQPNITGTHRQFDTPLVRQVFSPTRRQSNHTNFLHLGVCQSETELTCARPKKRCFSPKRKTVVGLASCRTKDVLDQRRVRLAGDSRYNGH